MNTNLRAYKAAQPIEQSLEHGADLCSRGWSVVTSGGRMPAIAFDTNPEVVR